VNGSGLEGGCDPTMGSGRVARQSQGEVEPERGAFGPAPPDFMDPPISHEAHGAIDYREHPSTGQLNPPVEANDRDHPHAGGELVPPQHDATIHIYDLKDQPAEYDSMGGERYPERMR
jgi:hypothetical protein